jgi:hypothetical protein
MRAAWVRDEEMEMDLNTIRVYKCTRVDCVHYPTREQV